MNFQKVFNLERSRFLDKRKVFVLLLFYLLAVYFIQSGIDQYKSNPEEIKRFQEFEKSRIESFQFYLQYGTYGFRLLYVPGPLSGLFNNAGIITSNLNAFIDSGERMRIYEPFKGNTVFTGYTSNFLNLSGLLLLLGSILSLLYGLESYRDRAFLRFLASLRGSRLSLFWSILVSRLLLLLASCFIITLTTWLLYLVNGVSADGGYIIIYGLVFFLMLAFFLLAGAIRKRWAGLMVVALVWLVFVFGLPSIVSGIVSNRAKSLTSLYEMDTQKFKLLMSFEKKAKEKAGKMDINKTNDEIRRELFNYLWNNEFKEIMGHEQSMINGMKDVISFRYNLSLIFPTSFFLSVNNEISGRGYESLMSFYEYVYKHKMGFVRYYADKTFFIGEKDVKPYLKGDKNIFYASGMLPGNFGFGLLIGFFWLLGLLFFNWLAFNRLLDRRPTVDKKDIKELKQDEFKRGKVTSILTFNDSLLYCFLETLRKKGSRFIFVPAPEQLPGDVKVQKLFDFFGLPVPKKLKSFADKYVSCLEKDYKALLIMEVSYLKSAEFYIFNNFLAGLSEKFAQYFEDAVDVLKRGRKVAYFTNTVPRIGDYVIRRANEKQTL